MIDVTYKKDLTGIIPTNRFVHEFTTEVSIVPDTFPFDDCDGEGCEEGAVTRRHNQVEG